MYCTVSPNRKANESLTICLIIFRTGDETLIELKVFSATPYHLNNYGHVQETPSAHHNLVVTVEQQAIMKHAIMIQLPNYTQY